MAGRPRILCLLLLMALLGACGGGGSGGGSDAPGEPEPVGPGEPNHPGDPGNPGDPGDPRDPGDPGDPPGDPQDPPGDDKPPGLDARPANPDCVAPARTGGSTTVSVEDAFPGAPAFVQPTGLIQAPGNPGRWYVLEKTGRVRTFSTQNPAAVSTWLDFSTRVNTASEGGLLGLAFDPDFPARPEVYVSWTGDPGAAMVSRIARVILDDVNSPDAVVEQELLTVSQPFTNHNGGHIAFGPDGYLYIGLGDGGSANDPGNRAQSLTTLLGKFLRIGVRQVAWPTPGYTIPAGNPFAGNPRCGPDSNTAPCPEIFAWGFRNPWRFSFDPATGKLWAADVGQNRWEEIDIVEAGGNYGWRCREGAHDFNTSGCPAAGLVEPVAEYTHGNGNVSITGGYVYRGAAIPGLVGRYVFADFASGRIWALRSEGSGYALEQLVDTSFQISAFGVDQQGELYFADFGNGRIRRLVPGSQAATADVPASLADTGCVVAGNPRALAPGVIPYAINAAFWSDGATKTRGLAIPDGSTIGIAADGDLEFPPGTLLVKRFDLDGVPVETRLLMRHPDGEWAGYTYEWNPAGTAATRVTGGKTRLIGSRTWIYPSEGDCLACHTTAAGVALGPELAQLDRQMSYAATGRTADQLATLAHIGLFATALPADVTALADPADTSMALAARARAYLHTNCAQCHRPGGPTPVDLDLRYDTPLAFTGTCDALPQAGDLGIADARILAPGDPDRSVLIARMGRRDAHGMPPLGSAVADTDGVALLSAWASALGGCG